MIVDLDFLLGVAREASDIILEVYATDFAVSYKSPRDPVTLADRRANDLICKCLRDRWPDVPIVAEESDPASFAEYRESTHVFFVDPLDGTREFVEKNGQFVVMIGLIDDAGPARGVIHAPVSGIAWAGERGSSAFETK